MHQQDAAKKKSQKRKKVKRESLSWDKGQVLGINKML